MFVPKRKNMQPKLIYCQDALCGWCFAFSPVIAKLAAEHSERLGIEVFAGGMSIGDRVRPIGEKAGYILNAIPLVEERTGVKFGEPFLRHLREPEKSSLRPDSEPPAIATVIFKEMLPDRSLEFAADLNAAMHRDGLDLSDLDNYRPIAEKYGLDAGDFLEKMMDENYVERAHYDFFLCQQLEVSGFPTLFLQTDQLHFFLLSRGYSDFSTIKARLEKVLAEWDAPKN